MNSCHLIQWNAHLVSGLLVIQESPSVVIEAAEVADEIACSISNIPQSGESSAHDTC